MLQFTLPSRMASSYAHTCVPFHHKTRPPRRPPQWRLPLRRGPSFKRSGPADFWRALGNALSKKCRPTSLY
eukprot:3650966-Pyramimonas_sp.AAC.1